MSVCQSAVVKQPINDDLFDGIPMVSRKKKRNMSNWKTCKRKRLKNSGKEYVSTCGEIMLAKTFAGLSTYCCKQKCTERVTNDECRTIFEGFWNLANHDAQSQFIAGCIRQKDVKTHSLSVLQVASAHQREFS